MSLAAPLSLDASAAHDRQPSTRRIVCVLPDPGLAAGIGRLLRRVVGSQTHVVLDPEGRALSSCAGCDAIVVGDDPMGERILARYGATGHAPVVVVCRSPAPTGRRSRIRARLRAQGAAVSIFAQDITEAVVELAWEVVLGQEGAGVRTAPVGVPEPSLLEGASVPGSSLLHELDALLAGAQGEVARFALFVIELGRFLLIEESLGTAASMALVTEILERIASRAGTGDVVAYLGRGRFGWLSDAVATDAIQYAIEQCTELPVRVGGEDVYPSAHIGLVLGTRQYACADDVVRDGIIAAGRARDQSAAAIFQTGMRMPPLEHLQLEARLRQAVAARAFNLVYQPIVDLQSKELVGFESLIRWQSEHGIVSPAEFIPLAEETGLIVAIGSWVLGEAAQQLAAWDEEFELGGRLLVSVNVSAKQLCRPAFVDEVRAVLAHTGLGPQCLKIEFTETAMAEGPAVADVLASIRALGVQVWVDDFGTGFSSLSHLQRFPISGLKLDKSFVDPLDGTPHGAAMADAILHMAASLGVGAVAEGVEHEAQRRQLVEMGYRLGQGYLFSKPLAVADAYRCIAQGRVE